MDDTARRGRLEELLETELGDPVVELSESRSAPDLDLRTTYVRVAVDPDRAGELAARAGLLDDSDPQARVLLVTGWRVEPGEQPAWWPDPATLTDRRARLLAPSRWLVSGCAGGWWYLLAAESGPIADPPTGR